MKWNEPRDFRNDNEFKSYIMAGLYGLTSGFIAGLCIREMNFIAATILTYFTTIITLYIYQTEYLLNLADQFSFTDFEKIEYKSTLMFLAAFSVMYYYTNFIIK